MDRLEEGQQLSASPITGAGITKPVAQPKPGFTHSQPSLLEGIMQSAYREAI